MSNLRSHVGETTVENMVQLSSASGSLKAFEDKVQQCVGDSGFMLVAEMDTGAGSRSSGSSAGSFAGSSAIR
jgi:hypothetical protein